MIQAILEDAYHLHSDMRTNQKLQARIHELAKACIHTLKNNRKIMLCGNGGSFADAQHITAELVGRFIKERPGLPALCLGCNASSMTAIGNDFSFDDIFSREVSAIGQAGDTLIGLSTSGNSKNVCRAIEVSKAKGIQTFGLTGRKKGAITRICDCIEVPSHHTPRIQEAHILIGHVICELIDDAWVLADSHGQE